MHRYPALAIAALATALTACSTHGPATDDAYTMARTSWTFVAPDTGTMVSTFDPEGRFRAEHEGQVLEQGDWRMDQGRLCEDIDGSDAPSICWTLARPLPAIGSSMTVTNDKGDAIEVTRVAYQASADGG